MLFEQHDLEGQLLVGAILFVLGAIGFLTRRNLIVMMLCAEMMLHGVSVNLTAFSRYHHNASGQAFTVFVLTIAACEAGLSLSLILALYQRRKSLDVQLWSNLGEVELTVSDEPTQITAEESRPYAGTQFPHLTPAGRAPKGSNPGVTPPA